jgi:peptidoglycan/LPS O-acetylase OafA/YrhL
LTQRHIDANSPPVVVLVVCAGVAGGWVLFRAVELPFMRLRSRWFPQHPGRDMAGVAARSTMPLLRPD